MTIDSVLSWLVEASIVLALVVPLVFIVRAAARRRLAAAWIYALWLAVPIALIASFAPSGLLELPIAQPARWLFAVWLFGVAGFSAADVDAHLRFGRIVVARARRPDGRELPELDRAIACTTLVTARDFLFSDLVDSPVACGLVRRVVLLPERFLDDYSPDERRIMTLHEAEHLRADHIPHRLVARTIRNLFWFHPLVWLAEHAFIADQELACDGAALRRDASIRPRIYAETLLKTAELIAGHASSGPAASAPLIATQDLRRRTAMLDLHASIGGTRTTGALLLGGVAAAALLAGLSLTTRAEHAPVVVGDAVPELARETASNPVEGAPATSDILLVQDDSSSDDPSTPPTIYAAPTGPSVMSQDVGRILNETIERLNMRDYAGARAAMAELDLDRLSAYERTRAEQILFQIAYASESYDEARSHLQAAIDAGGLNAQEVQNLRYQIAQSYLVEERWAEAARALEDWLRIEIAPSAAAHYLMAVSWYQLGDFAKALPHAQQAVELGNPAQRSWYQLLADLYVKLGMTAERDALVAETPREFLPLSPDNE